MLLCSVFGKRSRDIARKNLKGPLVTTYAKVRTKGRSEEEVPRWRQNENSQKEVPASSSVKAFWTSFCSGKNRFPRFSRLSLLELFGVGALVIHDAASCLNESFFQHNSPGINNSSRRTKDREIGKTTDKDTRVD